MTRIGRAVVFMAAIIAVALVSIAGAPRARALAPCGTVTTNLSLRADCTGTLTVGADNLTVNLNGRTVGCNGGGDGLILANRTGVTVKNGTVAECGITVTDGGGNTLKNLKTYGIGGGISVLRSNNNRIDGTDVSSSYGAGLSVSGNGNTIQRNYVHDSGGSKGAGIRVFGDNNVIRFNTVQRIQNTNGITVTGMSNIIRSNTVSNNTTAGIALYSGGNNDVRLNQAVNNDVGIAVSNSNNNVIRNNTANNNKYSGIFVYGASAGNSIRANTATSNGQFDLDAYVPSLCPPTNIWMGNTYSTRRSGCEN